MATTHPWRTACIVGLLAFIPPTLSAGQRPNRDLCPANVKKQIFEVRETGEVVEGPACVGVRFNALRYGAEFGWTITYTAGPNPQAPLPVPAAAAAAALGARTITAEQQPNGRPGIGALIRRYDDVRRQFIDRDRQNYLASLQLTDAINRLKDVVSQSDDVFGSGGGAAVITRATAEVDSSVIMQALQAQWTPVDDLYFQIRDLQALASQLELGPPPASDDLKSQIHALETEMTATLTDITAALSAGEKKKAFDKHKSLVKYWDGLIRGLRLESFTKTAYVRCGLSMNQNKQIAVRLLQTDRAPGLDDQPVAPTDLKDPFVTVNCSSPIAISAGLEFSFLATDTFGTLPTGAGGGKQFAVIEHDTVAPLPIAMLHVRLLETPGRPKAGLYASFGAAAHVQGDGTGGSSAEYLAGLSVGLFRTVFVNVGWHLGKVSKLVGYKPSDAVPMGVETVPVTNSYQSGFGLAITFTKP